MFKTINTLAIALLFPISSALALTSVSTIPFLDSHVLTSASVSAGTNGWWRSQHNWGSAAQAQSVIEGFTSLPVSELLSVRNDVLATLGDSVSSDVDLWFNVYAQDADGYHAYVGMDELGDTFLIQDYAGNWVDSLNWSVGAVSRHSILAPINPIREPTSALMLGLSLLGLSWRRRIHAASNGFAGTVAVGLKAATMAASHLSTATLIGNGLTGCATGRSRFVKPFGLLVLPLLAICATLCCGQFSTAGTITAHVTASNHDAEEHLNSQTHSGQTEYQGEMESLDSTDLEIGSEQDNGLDWQAVGVQFSNLGIAQGSTINSAILRLAIRNINDDWGDKNVTIFADNVGSSADFTEVDFNLSNRTRSSASVPWFLDRTGIAAGNNYDSPDLAPLVQEVVNREDWSENNQLSLLLFPDVYLANTAGSDTPVSDIGFYSFDHARGAAPQLIVDFTVIPEPASVTILGLIGTVGLLRRRRVFLASGRLRSLKSALLIVAAGAALAPVAYALDGGTLRVNPRNGWTAFEVISVGDNPSGDGFSWSMPGTFDGLGAWVSDSSTMRLLVNHEIDDAAISEVKLSLTSFQTAISNTISGGSTGGVTFVNSARQAYDRWSSDGGANWTNTTDTSNTSFSRFCSGQSYTPDTFGAGRVGPACPGGCFAVAAHLCVGRSMLFGEVEKHP